MPSSMKEALKAKCDLRREHRINQFHPNLYRSKSAGAGRRKATTKKGSAEMIFATEIDDLAELTNAVQSLANKRNAV